MYMQVGSQYTKLSGSTHVTDLVGSVQEAEQSQIKIAFALHPPRLGTLREENGLGKCFRRRGNEIKSPLSFIKFIFK